MAKKINKTDIQKLINLDFALFSGEEFDYESQRKAKRNRNILYGLGGAYAAGAITDKMDGGVIKALGKVPKWLVTNPTNAIVKAGLKAIGVKGAPEVETPDADAAAITDGDQSSKITKSQLYSALNHCDFSSRFAKDFNDDLDFIQAMTTGQAAPRVIHIGGDKRKGMSTGAKVALGLGGAGLAAILAESGALGAGAKTWVDNLSEKLRGKPEATDTTANVKGAVDNTVSIPTDVKDAIKENHLGDEYIPKVEAPSKDPELGTETVDVRWMGSGGSKIPSLDENQSLQKGRDGETYLYETTGRADNSYLDNYKSASGEYLAKQEVDSEASRIYKADRDAIQDKLLKDKLVNMTEDEFNETYKDYPESVKEEMKELRGNEIGRLKSKGERELYKRYDKTLSDMIAGVNNKIERISQESSQLAGANSPDSRELTKLIETRDKLESVSSPQDFKDKFPHIQF